MEPELTPNPDPVFLQDYKNWVEASLRFDQDALRYYQERKDQLFSFGDVQDVLFNIEMEITEAVDHSEYLQLFMDGFPPNLDE